MLGLSSRGGGAVSRADVAARGVIDQFALTNLPVDVEKVARELGATVVRQPTDDDVSGMLLRRDGQAVIGLNASLGSVGERFTLAHLVGHLKIHRRRDLILDGTVRHRHGNLTCMPTDREEAEANRFAGTLLMPEGAVRRAAREADFGTAAQLVGLLAPRFEVSASVMSYRLMGLGIILDV